jgi:thioredoxin reductase
MFLSTIAKHVFMLVRVSGLADSTSQYLIRRIEECADITLLLRTEIVELGGAGNLESVTWRGRRRHPRYGRGPGPVAALPEISLAV